jgi:hypothetical protein
VAVVLVEMALVQELMALPIQAVVVVVQMLLAQQAVQEL